MTKPTLLVLAAGMGSRYGGLKQIDPVGPAGETIIDYSIFDALRAGFGKLVFVIRKDIESQFYGQNAYKVLAQHLTSGTPDYAMVGFILKNTLSDHGTVARGVSRVDADNYLTHIVELTKIERDGSGAKDTGPDGKITRLTGDEAVSMNFWGFTPALFPQLREEFEKFMKKAGGELKSECLIPATVGELVTSGRAKCKVLRSPDSWFGVTYREDRPMVSKASANSSPRANIRKSSGPEPKRNFRAAAALNE
jgi:hypothetical protein